MAPHPKPPSPPTHPIPLLHHPCTPLLLISTPKSRTLSVTTNPSFLNSSLSSPSSLITSAGLHTSAKSLYLNLYSPPTTTTSSAAYTTTNRGWFGRRGLRTLTKPTHSSTLRRCGLSTYITPGELPVRRRTKRGERVLQEVLSLEILRGEAMWWVLIRALNMCLESVGSRTSVVKREGGGFRCVLGRTR